eukprot:CAMPEP_0170129780 /NCGR_PEP_ID=MMETSP0020_2-20130122/22104_1 /TAXON_ID=98059 /ORGANISM="Dinobryon sp., Strain UTEXLB2267" /LENGTH=883 /DNA_ID=CAMNT_0010364225 /DNA_START=226 /DNA_END=2877 /DNA_ORIENTATION=+
MAPSSNVYKPPLYQSSRNPSKSLSPNITIDKKVSPNYQLVNVKPLNAPTFEPSTAAVLVSLKYPVIRRATRSTVTPTFRPSKVSTKSPSTYPSRLPSVRPTTTKPSTTPTKKPSLTPTVYPSTKPTISPSKAPTTTIPSPKYSSQPQASKTISSTPTKAPIATVPPTIKDIVYHNNLPVMTGPIKLYNIFYGKIDSDTMSLVNYFAANINNSNWYNILTSYYQDINGVRTYISGSLQLDRSITIQSTLLQTNANVYTIQDIIIREINALNLPYDENGVYAVIFRGAFTFDKPAGWLSDWCGFHFNIPLINSKSVLKVVVIGDASSVPYVNREKCMSFTDGTTPNRIFADNLVNHYANTLSRVVTNAYGAWHFDYSSPESIVVDVGVACAWDFGATTSNANIVLGSKSFLIQQIWRRGYGCSMSATPTRSPTAVPNASPLSKSGSRGFPTIAPANLPTVSPNLPDDVNYHGGPVLQGTVNLYNIYLGDFTNSSVINGSRRNTTTLMDYFAANIGNTSWYKIISSYYQITTDKIIYASNSAKYISSLNLQPTARALSYSDSNIQREIYNSLLSQTLPTDENAVYVVMFRGDFSVSFEGYNWLTDFCSYHSAFLLPSGLLIKYAVIGDPSSAPGKSGSVCQPSVTSSGVAVSANGDVGADSMASEYAQNLAEVVTDFFGAWYSNRTGFEVGGACRGQFGPLVNGNSNLKVGALSFLVQKLWQPGYGCTMSKIISSSVPSPTSLSSWSPSVNPSIAPSTTTFPSSAPTSILTASPSSSTVFNRFPSGSPFRLTVPPSVTSTSSPNCNHGNGNGNGNGNCGKSPSTNSPTVSASKIPSASPRSLNAVNTPTVLTSTKPTIAVPTTPTTLKSNRPSAKPTARSKVNANY